MKQPEPCRLILVFLLAAAVGLAPAARLQAQAAAGGTAAPGGARSVPRMIAPLEATAPAAPVPAAPPTRGPERVQQTSPAPEAPVHHGRMARAKAITLIVVAAVITAGIVLATERRCHINPHPDACVPFPHS